MSTKHPVKIDLPIARKKKDTEGNGFHFVVKNQYPSNVVSVLESKGWTKTGESDYGRGREYGMSKGDVFIRLSDSGKFPYFTGDTSIYPDKKLIGTTPYRGGPIVEPMR